MAFGAVKYKNLAEDPRTAATILCALRRFVDPAHGNYIEEHFDDVGPLNEAEIDRFCEQVNLGEITLHYKRARR